ncbi:hypothetical protein AB9K41_27640, partial [Cribrihabitans sp. XS_ASV171]
MADRQEFREGKQQHRRRRLGLAGAVLALVCCCIWVWTRTSGAGWITMLSLVVTTAVLSIPEVRRLRRPARLLVTVGDEGLGLRLPDESLQVFSWDRVRSFELPWHPGNPPDGAFVNVDHPRRGRMSYGLPLNSFDPGVGQALIEALRRHWPDLDEPWQV